MYRGKNADKDCALAQCGRSIYGCYTKNVQNAVKDWTLVIGHLSVAFGWQTAPKNVRRGA